MADNYVNQVEFLDENGEVTSTHDIQDVDNDELARIDGSYEDMTVGQLVSKVEVVDKVPYLFRTSGGSADIGNREYDEIVGGSVVWNQLANVQDGLTISGVTITSNGDGSYILNGTATAVGTFLISDALKSNHVYLVVPNSDGNVRMFRVGWPGSLFSTARIEKRDTENVFAIRIESGVTYSNSRIRPNVYDITDLFDTTIADYIYSLEQTASGAGAAKLKEWGFFAKDYYGYDPGTFKHVEGLISHKTVEFNQWDEEWEVGAYSTTTGDKIGGNNVRSKNKVRVLPDTIYRFTSTSTTSPLAIPMMFYDANGVFVKYSLNSCNATFLTPSNAHYMTFYCGTAYGTTYKHDICINIRWSGYRDGEYEPYREHVYPLDSSLILRGVAKLDDNYELYYDGDIYMADGTVERRYGERAYQSGDENDSAVKTDGTTTVYLLSTPTIETAEPYQEVQIVDDFGTEEYVTDSIIPVGHTTRYPANLRDKLQRLPDSAGADGDYIVRQSGSQMALVPITEVKELPETPTANGTYRLTATVVDGTPTFAWVSA